ncbi:hypothetical protein M6B38_285635 [Iris pallida]|uniref:Uncharacterized protein n=1 Tax=Iris pallida TaxID=29817 RepID=A0AAX6HZ68_IRIPA|nr:hypothetical protein M6B38_385495 [Iris pallida]KAJ6845784.1 hypothetical protein M6B38_285635 [Iris pallida]
MKKEGPERARGNESRERRVRSRRALTARGSTLSPSPNPRAVSRLGGTRGGACQTHATLVDRADARSAGSHGGLDSTRR